MQLLCPFVLGGQADPEVWVTEDGERQGWCLILLGTWEGAVSATWCCALPLTLQRGFCKTAGCSRQALGEEGRQSQPVLISKPSKAVWLD